MLTSRKLKQFKITQFHGLDVNFRKGLSIQKKQDLTTEKITQDSLLTMRIPEE